jgi:xylan 1,4-beta-xylosidase
MRINVSTLLVALAGTLAALPAQTITIDAHAKGTRFPHFWEQGFGSGRAVLSLRESYRHDLDAVKKITGFQYVRFHAIFHDENGVYSEDAQGKVTYNFNQVDLIYDGLLAHGVKPYVELSFMPRQLASKPAEHAFWYKPIVAPPKDSAKWEALVEAFARHLVERYGINEVASWYFEVWNEPNIDFWVGEPKYETYCDLYDVTARALKLVSPRLRVGGPATAQAAWTGRFIEHCAKSGAPIDFVSTHVYANDTPQDVFGTAGPVDRRTMLPRAVDKVFQEVKHSARPDLPIHWSEFNASYMNEVDVTDSPYMGPWLAMTIAACEGKVALMSYWSFSDVFEEQGIFKTPYYGGFGLIANHSIPKAAFNVFRLLHLLGDERLAVDSDSVLATRRKDGSLAIALWNYAEPGATGAAATISLKLEGTPAQTAVVQRVDAAHGSSLETWIQMGRPSSPNPEQTRRLRNAAAAGKPETVKIVDGRLDVQLPAPGLALVEIPTR